MKIHFKTLDYQKDAVKAVVDCFVGQPKLEGHRYMIDQGVTKSAKPSVQDDMFAVEFGLERGKTKKIVADIGFENAQIFNLDAVLKNIQNVQIANILEPSSSLIVDDIKGKNLTGSPLNLNIEMETGTGKTYCYIRTMFELNKHYGWSKFIIVVPSVAIREGVYKSLDMMADHFHEQYGKKARSFIYDSKTLDHLESFSSNAGINVMVINVQAFNTIKEGANNDAARKIYSVLDEFQSRRPIDVISRNRPILILDEPQKMGAENTLKAMANFNPLFILRYSATHKRNYNLVYRLDALDAYNQKLVKKITVKGIEVQGLSGTHGYLYLQDIIVSKSAPVARLELEIAEKNGFRRLIRQIKKGDNLYNVSGQAEQYHDRYVVIDIDARDNSVTFENGRKIHVGEAVGHIDEHVMRTIQIRETIRAHLQKERQLYNQGIKVLSLFFIDEVAKYRQYDEDNNPIDGEYTQIFKEQYQFVLNEFLDLNIENDPYQEYLKSIDVNKTHNGYFSIDKKSRKLTDPALKKVKDEELGVSIQQADDIDAYDLILKDKERLLSFEEPTRFIFSHSALREGWDNPNVFVICTLKHSDNTISRRQEVGRGLRLAVNKNGERMDANYFGALGEVHRLNNLTVVTNESYKDFVAKLQTEIVNTLASRPTQATPEYFEGKVFTLSDGSKLEVTKVMAKQIHKYLTRNDYIDDNDHIAPKYHQDKANGEVVALPEELQPYTAQITKLIDSIFDPKATDSMTEDANKCLTNYINSKNLERKEFQDLWKKINRKAVYQIQLDSEKLIQQSISAVEDIAVERNNKFVETLSYKLAEATQNDESTYEQVKAKEMFGKVASKTEVANISIQSQVTYDLIGNIADNTNLTRKTVARILQGINAGVFAQFKLNPEAFIREMSRIINEQQAKMVIQGLKYNPLESIYSDNEIFVSNESIPLQSFKADRHIWDYVVTDSDNERKFVEELDGADEVIVYAKLPDRFQIPTPFGNYNPDWAIAFDKDKVRQVYFVAETKGSMDDVDLRDKEKRKVESAKKFFATLNEENQSLDDAVKYAVIDSFSNLMSLVK
ncbi:DEAD/DEAH box helicase family protein [Acinetobacter baumannii]|uniref:type III restriction-modification system endonuclease n=1 Tax=Acinetobacter baumannii TaxID=470 RepID=UPI000DE7914F|nr:DEAD/DEAH box helicase family protein [Acinetobacter baumannii]MDC5106517.1 DEAD/DEAH box helicase family protein [Acinetobacter baumannii]MDC5456021.1 DEAD/DEAH box helicase family protein [Acinetobacter baumannii]MDO7374237.1 DEAD/DEAH box helicase family protein [Acinetobacter baumannii]SSS77460.1 type III restriction-modification system StyLTI enzyme res [Acinetobacter baumannii]